MLGWMTYQHGNFPLTASFKRFTYWYKALLVQSQKHIKRDICTKRALVYSRIPHGVHKWLHCVGIHWYLNYSNLYDSVVNVHAIFFISFNFDLEKMFTIQLVSSVEWPNRNDTDDDASLLLNLTRCYFIGTPLEFKILVNQRPCLEHI